MPTAQTTGAILTDTPRSSAAAAGRRRALICTLLLATATWTLAVLGCAANPRTDAQAAGPVAGEPAPPVTAVDAMGQPFDLDDHRGQWVVLYFYPKADTPGCTCQATEFTGLVASFDRLDAKVVGVSPDTPAANRRFIENYHLRLTLLSDPAMRVMRDYGAVTHNGADAAVRRSTVLIDPEGRIAWRWSQVTPEGHADRVLGRLATLAARG